MLKAAIPAVTPRIDYSQLEELVTARCYEQDPVASFQLSEIC